MSIEHAPIAVDGGSVMDGDTVYAYLKSNVLRIGTYMGAHRPPCADTGDWLCVGIHPQRHVFEWIRYGHVRKVVVVAKATEQTAAGPMPLPPGTSYMTPAMITEMRIQAGDRIYFQYWNDVVRSGVFFGLHALPWAAERKGICVAQDDTGDVVDWIAPECLKAAALTIPAAVLERVVGGSSPRDHKQKGSA